MKWNIHSFFLYFLDGGSFLLVLIIFNIFFDISLLDGEWGSGSYQHISSPNKHLQPRDCVVLALIFEREFSIDFSNKMVFWYVFGAFLNLFLRQLFHKNIHATFVYTSSFSSASHRWVIAFAFSLSLSLLFVLFTPFLLFIFLWR